MKRKKKHEIFFLIAIVFEIFEQIIAINVNDTVCRPNNVEHKTNIRSVGNKYANNLHGA